MGRVERDRLGARMKEYEAQCRFVLPRRTYTILRLDGRAFHSWTKGLNRPYDETMLTAMAATSKKLCSEISGAVFAYTQSDEISILVQDFASPDTQPWFGGVVQKLASVSASVATAEFNSYWDRPPAYFDARCFTIEQAVEVANYFVWRQKDARRNAISMIAEQHWSANELHGRPTSARREMLEAQGLDLDREDQRFMMGQVVYPVTVFESVVYTDKRTGEECRTPMVERRVLDTIPAPEFRADQGWLVEQIHNIPDAVAA
jgi:tRNA(His) 5'-end guanylyltransferase